MPAVGFTSDSPFDSHHGACGASATVGSANGTPPSAFETDASQSHAERTSSGSNLSTSSRISSAFSRGTGWLDAPRMSGSSALPNPPSSLR